MTIRSLRFRHKTVHLLLAQRHALTVGHRRAIYIGAGSAFTSSPSRQNLFTEPPAQFISSSSSAASATVNSLWPGVFDPSTESGSARCGNQTEPAGNWSSTSVGVARCGLACFFILRYDDSKRDNAGAQDGVRFRSAGRLPAALTRALRKSH